MGDHDPDLARDALRHRPRPGAHNPAHEAKPKLPMAEACVPTEFRYWDRVGDRRVQLARRAWQAVWRFDPQPPERLVEQFAQGYYDADPVAEAFVDEVYLQRGATRGPASCSTRRLEHGVDAVQDAPDSMRRLFAEFERDPEWLDREQVELGAKVFRRYGTSVFSFATTSTLEMYSESSITKPLSLSGGYAGEAAHKRQLETVRFWIDITEPGGLNPGARGPSHGDAGPGHARVHPPAPDPASRMGPAGVGGADLDLGRDADLDGRQRRAGAGAVERRASDDDPGDRGAAALLALCRASARRPAGLVPDGLQAGGAADVRGVRQARLHRRPGREGAGRVLPAGVRPQARHALRKRLRDELNYRTQIGYTRFWMLPASYRRHEMPNPWPWALHPLAQFPVVLTLESFRRLLPPLDSAADRVQRWRRNNWYANETGGRDAEFQPVQEFRR